MPFILFNIFPKGIFDIAVTKITKIAQRENPKYQFSADTKNTATIYAIESKIFTAGFSL